MLARARFISLALLLGYTEKARAKTFSRAADGDRLFLARTSPETATVRPHLLIVYVSVCLGCSFLGFLKEGHAHMELSMIHVLHRNFTSLLSMVRPSLIVNLRKLHPFVSVVSLRIADLSGSIPSLVVVKPVLRTRPE